MNATCFFWGSSESPTDVQIVYLAYRALQLMHELNPHVEVKANIEDGNNQTPIRPPFVLRVLSQVRTLNRAQPVCASTSSRACSTVRIEHTSCPVPPHNPVGAIFLGNCQCIRCQRAICSGAENAGDGAICLHSFVSLLYPFLFGLRQAWQPMDSDLREQGSMFQSEACEEDHLDDAQVRMTK